MRLDPGKLKLGQVLRGDDKSLGKQPTYSFTVDGDTEFGNTA